MIDRRKVLIGLGLLRIIVGPAAAAEDGIVGVWCAPKGKETGPLDEWIFRNAGQAALTRGGRLDSTYEIVGNRIKTTTRIEPEGAGPSLIEFRIEGDTLILDKDARYRRTGDPYPSAHPIVGEWSITHPNGQHAILRLSRNGALQMFFPVGQPVTGSYRREGNLITIDGGSGTTTFNYDPQKRVLVGSTGAAWWKFDF